MAAAEHKCWSRTQSCQRQTARSVLNCTASLQSQTHPTAPAHAPACLPAWWPAGVAAARLAADAVLGVLEAKLPQGPPPPYDAPGFLPWREDVQLALVETLAELNRTFALKGILAGCTATLVMQVHRSRGPRLRCSACGGRRARLAPSGGDAERTDAALQARRAAHLAALCLPCCRGAVPRRQLITQAGPAPRPPCLLSLCCSASHAYLGPASARVSLLTHAHHSPTPPAGWLAAHGGQPGRLARAAGHGGALPPAHGWVRVAPAERAMPAGPR